MRQQWMAAEELGADALYTSDHFFAQDTSNDATAGEGSTFAVGMNFEAMTIQAAMAATTTRPQIGCLVHGVGFRNPHLTADMARTIDHISNGRFILGLGTGYMKEDFVEYGYEWVRQKERSLNLAAKVPIIKDRLSKLNPPPLRKLPILIGAMGSKIGMPLVAHHADIWHAYGTGEQLAVKIEELKELCMKIGRDFNEIEIATWYTRGALHIDIKPDDIYALGIRNIIQLQIGPHWDLGILRELLQWRDSLSQS